MQSETSPVQFLKISSQEILHFLGAKCPHLGCWLGGHLAGSPAGSTLQKAEWPICGASAGAQRACTSQELSPKTTRLPGQVTLLVSECQVCKTSENSPGNDCGLQQGLYHTCSYTRKPPVSQTEKGESKPRAFRTWLQRKTIVVPWLKVYHGVLHSVPVIKAGVFHSLKLTVFSFLPSQDFPFTGIISGWGAPFPLWLFSHFRQICTGLGCSSEQEAYESAMWDVVWWRFILHSLNL